jgi:hypothetical protein
LAAHHQKEAIVSDTFESILAVLVATPLRWMQLVETLPESWLQERPVPGEWSMMECLQHLIVTERIFPVRLEALRNGQDILAMNPTEFSLPSGEVPTPRLLLTHFMELREASLWLVRQVTDDMLERHGQHSEFGTVTLGELLHEWAAHDLDHTMQAERVLMQPFIQGCGPWKPFFAPHLITEPTAG